MITPSMNRPLLFLAATFIAVSCGGDVEQVITEQRGDTLVVVSREASTVRPRSLRIALRVGSIEGGSDTAFGRLEEIAVLPWGGFAVHDNHYMRVSMFDESGAFLRRVGSTGQGPGEFDGVKTIERPGTRVLRTLYGFAVHARPQAPDP